MISRFNEYNNSKFYTKVYADVYYKLMSDRSDFLSHLPDWNEDERKIIDKLEDSPNVFGFNVAFFYIKFYHNKIHYEINKCLDEWFIITLFHPYTDLKVYYKCDQFDGVVEFLKDKGIIKYHS